MKKLDASLMVRCENRDRQALKSLCSKLGVSESTLARVALRTGLAVVKRCGIRVEDAAQEQHAAGA